MGQGRYKILVQQVLPPAFWAESELADDMAEQHALLANSSMQNCEVMFLDMVLQWSLYGSMMFSVEQNHVNTLSKKLWIAINLEGIHLISR